MDGTRPGKGPGRPVVLAECERRRRLFDAAVQIFIAHGYAASTMGAIALAAGMSKKTLYQLFPSKLALFDAVLADRIFTFPETEPSSGGSLEDELTHLLIEIANVLLHPERTGLIRLIVADGQAFPELMTAFERLRVQKNLNAVEQWLDRHRDSGVLQIANVSEAARFLFGMTIAEPTLLALLNAPRSDDDPSLQQRIRTGVKIFLHGISAAA
jgi:AcrR family transcriptional regulator